MSKIEVRVGDVYQAATGEVMKFIKIDSKKGVFEARLKSLQGIWTDFVLKGDVRKLPAFLSQPGYKKVDPKDHPETDGGIHA